MSQEFLFNVVKLKFKGQPYPIEWTAEGVDYNKMQSLTGLLDWEIDYGIETGEVVNGLYMIMLTPEWEAQLHREVRQAAVEKVKAEKETRADVVKEISRQMGISSACFCMHITNAIKKIQASGKQKEFIANLLELYKLRNRKSKPETICTLVYDDYIIDVVEEIEVELA